MGTNTADSPGRAPARAGSRAFAVAIGAVLLAAVGAAFLVRGLSRKTVAPSFQRLTFRKGTVGTARFAPDGQTVVYSAAWEDDPTEVFVTRPESPESRPLGLKNASLLAVSSTGELAVMLDARTSAGGDDTFGTLARMPLAGGSPRPVMENVRYADWSPDGRELMVARAAGNKNSIEFPPGKVIYETTARINSPRLSPRGDAVAFFESPVDAGLGRGKTSIRVVDLSGKARILASIGDWWTLAWSADGKEIWYAAPEPDTPVTTESLQAVTLSGKRRPLMRYLGILEFHDVSRDGRVLLTRGNPQPEGIATPPGESKDRALTPLDASSPADLSPADKARRAQESLRSYERATGRKAILKDGTVETILVASDTRSYVYGSTKILSDLYIVNGLK